MTLKTLTKSSVWDVQENDIFRMWEGANNDSEVHENIRHYADIIRKYYRLSDQALRQLPDTLKYQHATAPRQQDIDRAKAFLKK